ncbi:MAG: oligopeptidase A [Halioglobus sp.]|jgi:oligopeptidase A
MTNPLLQPALLPPFSQIRAEHVEPAISSLIADNKQSIDRLLAANSDYSWDNLLAPIEALEDDLAKAWSPVGHLNNVMNTDELRDAYNACLSQLSDYRTWMGQHAQLHAAYQQIAEGDTFSELNNGQKTAIEHALRDFRLAGVALPPTDKQRYGVIQSRLSELSSQFSDNSMDASNAWSKQVTQEQLKGLPETALASAKQRAEQKDLEGYLINLEGPSFQPVLTYCDDGQLREEIYCAYITKASDQGPHAGQWDNSDIIDEILTLRHELATLLSFDSYAEVSLATKMAESPDRVVQFLKELADKSKDQASAEWKSLNEFAKSEHGVDTINAWDVAYYSEKLRLARFSVSQEDIRPYLPAPLALKGLFEVCRRLYGVEMTEVNTFDSYHDDVQLYELKQDGAIIARFYLDLYARPHKQNGAWMDDCRVRRYNNGTLQLPVAYLVCNFTPPLGDSPALLTDNELVTLFHEFGHGLHHMLTRQSVASVSGINGVAWDAVELPSQFLENWCWEKEALTFISGHYETGESLPPDLLEKMLAAKNFQSAMGMARQLEFSTLDFRLHMEWGKPDCPSVQTIVDSVRADLAVIEAPAWNRFQNSFSHIFGGGYAAGYYSYKWAEVLSADAFAKFEEEGIFNAETGASFRQNILEMGGARDPMESFIAFRGRTPDIQPLLRHCGIAA